LPSRRTSVLDLGSGLERGNRGKGCLVAAFGVGAAHCRHRSVGGDDLHAGAVADGTIELGFFSVLANFSTHPFSFLRGLVFRDYAALRTLGNRLERCRVYHKGDFLFAFGAQDVVGNPGNPLPRSAAWAVFQEVSRHLGFLRIGADGLHAIVSALGADVARVTVAATAIFVIGDGADMARRMAPRDDPHLTRRTVLVWHLHSPTPACQVGNID